MPISMKGVLTGIFIGSDAGSLVTKRKEIVRVFDNGLERRFPKAAHNKRGVVAVVENIGCIKEGSSVTVWVSDQLIYY